MFDWKPQQLTIKGDYNLEIQLRIRNIEPLH